MEQKLRRRKLFFLNLLTSEKSSKVECVYYGKRKITIIIFDLVFILTLNILLYGTSQEIGFVMHRTYGLIFFQQNIPYKLTFTKFRLRPRTTKNDEKTHFLIACTCSLLQICVAIFLHVESMKNVSLLQLSI